MDLSAAQGRDLSRMCCDAVLTSGIGFLERASVSEKVLERYGDHVTELKLHAGLPDLVKRSDEAVDLGPLEWTARR